MTPYRPNETAEAPFHEGERWIQQRVGIAEKIQVAAQRSIRDFMPDQHRAFFAQLPFLVVGSLDASGHPLASILTGAPGFITSPDERELWIHARPHPADRLGDALAPGMPLGLLGIELHTRRRNRVNGRVSRCGADGFGVRVDQSFGNCPKYIQARTLDADAEGWQLRANVRIHRSAVLDADMCGILKRSDTFFIATAHPGARSANDGVAGVDVSHRGGKPGFVTLESSTELTFPDYQGNFFFNTLGNLLLNPRAGLLFVDFDSGDLLSLKGEGFVVWDEAEIATVDKALRLVRFRVTEATRMEAVIPWHWSPPVISPHLLP
ncbi:pyridoxamine 5'-phosphate oxidase family protein [Mangrovitalea sediminis]|uniref:pyridoxamine 5'-phosphate oxidase family protein n=1 Tax=Mangrovitalea sediminis TaxID=1982043 RepID=UPI000BE53D8C|nr:pyridoxamine 5'-phosphate oxidase family protein [Mangrovitalea sediminis]